MGPEAVAPPSPKPVPGRSFPCSKPPTASPEKEHMAELYDVAAIGNAIVDVIAPATDDFLAQQSMDKGAMMLVDEARSAALYTAMAPGVEASGGSAANSIAGVASFGGRGAFLGKVADDQLGKVFTHDMRAIGAHFDTPPLLDGKATAVSMINVTPDGERTMSTFLGASTEFASADIDPAVIEAARIVYLEGYLFDKPAGKSAFLAAANACHKSGGQAGIALSDPFCVDRHRGDFRTLVSQTLDYVIGNAHEWESLYQTNIDEALRLATADCDTVICTRSPASRAVTAI